MDNSILDLEVNLEAIPSLTDEASGTQRGEVLIQGHVASEKQARITAEASPFLVHSLIVLG